MRLTAGASYRIVLPVSMIGGAAFLVLADVLARTVAVPGRGADRRDHRPGRRALLPVHPPSRRGAGRSSRDLLPAGRRRYGSAQALAEVSEQVPAGQWLAIIGRNGTGKSTLLRAAARLVGHEGTITIGGQQTGRMSRRALARLVAYVPQLPELPPDMTALDYVLLGRTPHIGYLGTETQADRDICAGLLDRMDLGPMAGRRLGTLSGGELQRAVLARALAQDAPVLLLDEPTSALDLGRRVAALELVDELRRERSLTVLSVVHDLTLAGQFADRLLLLDGRPGRGHRGPGQRPARRRADPSFRGTVAGADHGGRGAGGHLTASWSRVGPPGRQTPRFRPMISFMISVVPPKIVCTRLSANARATGYSAM